MSEDQFLLLSNAAACLPPTQNHCQLKSHLLWICSIIGGKSVAKSAMCPKCCQKWSTGKFALQVKPTVIPGSRMKKILSKVEKAPHELSRMESSLLKHYHQNSGSNKMVLTCMTCKHETVTSIKKPSFQKMEQTKTVMPQSEVVVMSSKKKKRKDRFAGLNASAVISATPSPVKGSLKTSSIDRVLNYSSPMPKNILRNSPLSTPVGKTSDKSITSANPLKLFVLGSNGKTNGPTSVKKKMKLLRAEVKLSEETKIQEEIKALQTRKLNVLKNNKLQNFLKKGHKEVHIEDRINSLLQL